MAMFVHLSAEKNVKAILRNGITRLKKLQRTPQGIFAMPVTRNFYVSHQWLRELKRRGHGPVAGVYFRIADEQTVWVGHYNQPHKSMTAAQALALIAGQESPQGYQVIVPRRITRSEIPPRAKTSPGGRLEIPARGAWYETVSLPHMRAGKLRCAAYPGKVRLALVSTCAVAPARSGPFKISFFPGHAARGFFLWRRESLRAHCDQTSPFACQEFGRAAGESKSGDANPQNARL